MAEKAYYVGIDVGTGSARACVMSDSGDIVSMASHDIRLWSPHPHYHEQSTTDIWQSICKSVKQAVGESKIDVATIKGIGLDATCSLAVFSDKDDKPVSITKPDFDNEDGEDRNVILWLDHRAEKEIKVINATGHNLLRYVGGSMSIEMEIPKILWLKNNMPTEIFEKCKFYDLGDALTHMATGNETRSTCSVVCKQGYLPLGVDGSSTGWQKDFMIKVGLEKLTENDFEKLGGVDEKTGQYVAPGQRIGGLTDQAAADMGLKPGTAVGASIIDAYAGWIGTIGAKIDLDDHQKSSVHGDNNICQATTRLAAVAGTSTCHIAMSEKPIFVEGIWGPYRDVAIRNYWFAEGGQSATGQLLKFVIETHPAYKEAMSSISPKSTNSNIYSFLNKRLQDMKSSNKAPTISYLGRHIFFYGDVFGNRSPIGDSAMRGSVIGLSSDTSIDNLAIMYYATMEFIALQTRQIIERMNESGHKLSSIFMSGSQCKNEILMDLIATVCKMPVVVPKYVDSAVVHGAAMLSALAAREDVNVEDGKGSLWDIMVQMSKPGTKVMPGTDEREKKLLDEKYRVFLEMCEEQRTRRKAIDAVCQGWTD